MQPGLPLIPALRSLAAAMIYHLAKKPAWEEALTRGTYHGAEEDRADGFLHFSTDRQIRDSARIHRAGETDLVLLFVDDTRLGDALVWEASRSGQLFPHLYGPLDMGAVTRSVDLTLDDAGDHVFPDHLPPSPSVPGGDR